MTPATTIQAMWLMWLVSWLVAASWSDHAVKRPAAAQQILYKLLTGVGAVLLFGLQQPGLRSTTSLWHTPVGLAWVMAAVVLAGLAFTWSARIHLGRLWSGNVTRKADHHVVDTGPYRIVRHPIYTGIILASVGTAAARGTALAWLGVVVMTAGWVIKARLEEEFLREQLGAESYDEYARRVPMLAPLPRRKRSM